MNETEPVPESSAALPAPVPESDPFSAFQGRPLSPDEQFLLALLRVVPDSEPPFPESTESSAPESVEAGPIPAMGDAAEVLNRLLALPELTERLRSPIRRDPVVPALPSPGPVPAAAEGASEAAPPTPDIGGQPRLAVALSHPVTEAGAAGHPGAVQAVADACGRLVCAGAIPEAAWTGAATGSLPAATLSGFTKSCRALHVRWLGSRKPLLESSEHIHVVGVLPRVDQQVTPWFKAAGDVLLLLGDLVDPEDPDQGLGGSLYLRRVHGTEAAQRRSPDLEATANLHCSLRGLIQEGVVRSALDCGPGGLMVCLWECTRGDASGTSPVAPLGMQLEVPDPAADAGPAPRADALLFGESPNRVLITVSPVDAGRVLKQCRILGVSAVRLGIVGGDSLRVKVPGAEFEVSLTGTPLPGPAAGPSDSSSG